MKIKEMVPEYRPRERLMTKGVQVLSDAELLAIILQKGTKRENVVDMSHKILFRYSLDKLQLCTLAELSEIEGIGLAKACQILATFELGRRLKSRVNHKRISQPREVFEYMSPKMSHLDKEHLYLLHLDSKNNIMKEELISVGTLNSSLIHPREVFKAAIRESANAVILVHNHPSGDPTPSDEDREVTERIMEAGELLKIKVLDHVIIGKGEFSSFH